MERNYKPLQNGSDIRGIALPGVEGEEVNLTAEAAGHLAAGFVSWLAARTGKAPSELVVAVGRDPRLSGQDIMDAFVAGVAPYGVRVLNCGIATTPAMFMSCVFEDIAADGSCMVTASHLPWNRNGLKFFSRDGGLEHEDIAAIVATAGSDEALAALPTAEPKAARGCDLIAEYAAHLRGLIQAAIPGEAPLAGLKVCVDAGNGSAGFYARQVLAPLGADTSASQFLDPDGTFPNHQPNPENEAAMASICATVKEQGCDLGLIFDTDVDRSSAVDETGAEINRNAIIALAAALIADEHPGTTVVTDSVTSNQLAAFLEDKLGLVHLRFRRGYRNVINKMIELNAAGQDCQLAIETSGHAAYLENYSLDDGAYLATRIVIKAAQLAAEGRKISSLVADLTEPAESIERRMNITVPDFAAAGDAVLEAFASWVEGAGGAAAAEQGMALEVVKPNYEGVRVAVSGEVNGWCLLRKSLHDPLMPLNVESDEEGGAMRILALLRTFLEAQPVLDTSRL